MADLLGLLGLGSAGLSAQHTGVAVAANNAANVNTAGYSRQRVDLRSELAAPLVGGVRAASPTRMENQLLENRARASRGALGASSAMAPALSDLESRMTAGGSIDGAVAELWVGLERVSAMPSDSLVRQAAIAAAMNLADGMRRRAVEVAQARNEADARIRDTADQVTALARDIATANRAIAISSDPVLRDRRDVAAANLAELVGGTGRIDPDGQMRWVLPDGAVLVDGAKAATMTTTRDPVSGFRAVEVVDGSNRRAVTTRIPGGRMGGDLAFRDVEAATTADDLDQLAFDIARNFNAVHQAHAGSDGVVGRDLFTSPTTVVGAAVGFAVDAALVANPTRLATAAPGSGAGDGTGALALLALRDQPIGGGGTTTLTDAAIEIGASLGRRAATADITAVRDRSVTEHLTDLRDAVAGVDIEEELAKMVHFQHASEAMTRFLGAVDGLLGDLLDRL